MISYIILLTLSLLPNVSGDRIVGDDIAISTREEPPAIMNNIFSAQCGTTVLRVEGIGGLPEAVELSVTLGGVRSSVDSPDLVRQLSLAGAVYRFSAKCSQTGTIIVNTYRAARRQTGETDYTAGQFSIAPDGTLRDEGEWEFDEESFWFR